MRLTFTLTIVHPVEYIVTCRIYETCKIEVWCDLEVSALFMRCTSNAHNLLLIIKTVECLENLCSEWNTGGEKGTWGISFHCPLQCRTGSICTHVCAVPDPLIRIVSGLQPLCGTSWVSPAAHPPPLSPRLKEPACKLAFQLFPVCTQKPHCTLDHHIPDCRWVCRGWNLVTAMLGTDPAEIT